MYGRDLAYASQLEICVCAPLKNSRMHPLTNHPGGVHGLVVLCVSSDVFSLLLEHSDGQSVLL